MKYFGWIFLFFIMLYIVPLGSRPLLLPEFDTAAITREMVLSGHYFPSPVIETIAGNEIPPMIYWITAGSYKLFGINGFATRLPSALAVGITALLIALLIKQHLRDEKLAALSATIFLSFSLVLLAGSVGSPLMWSIMAVTGVLSTLFLAAQEPVFNRRQILLTILGGLFTALGFLTLGNGAWFFPAMILIPYLVFSGKFRNLAIIIPGWLIFTFLPLLPWLGQLIQNPDLWNGFFSFAAYKAEIGTYPWYIYLLNVIIGLFPVWVLLPAAMMTGKDAWKKLWNQELCRFAVLSIVLPLVYFLIFRRSITGLTVLTFPPLAILTAMGLQAYFNNGGHHRSFDWMLNIWSFILLICGISEVVLWFMPEKVLNYFSILPFTQTVLLPLGVASLLGGSVLLYSMRGNWRSRLYLYFFTIAILPLGISWCFRPNYAMPETMIRCFIEQKEMQAENAIIYTSAELAPAIDWCSENGTEILDICFFDQKDLTNNNKTVYVILGTDDHFWEAYPQYQQMIKSGSLSCARYPRAVKKDQP